VFQNAVEQPVEPVEEIQECVTLRSPREVVADCKGCCAPPGSYTP